MRDPATVRLGRTGCVAATGLGLRVRSIATCLAVWAILVPPGLAVAEYTVVADHGPSSNRVNIVFLGDGYTAGQIETDYASHINTILAHMFGGTEDPFGRYADFFNVYRVNVVSNESGADAPPLGISRDTALDASYYWNGSTERLLFLDSHKAAQVRDAALSGSGIRPDINLVTVNDTRYGGGGDGTFAVCAGGNINAGELALHEMGHSFSGLADEYDDSNSSSVSIYTGSEPAEVNVTKDPNGAKWSRWLGYDQGGNLGVVGAYQGARYYDQGLYRSSITSKMRQPGQPFNAVSREKIILDIYNIVHPIDSYIIGPQEEDQLTDPQNLWVDVVDPNVINVNWYVNGKLVTGADDEQFNMADFGYGPGSYSVKVRAYDATDWVRANRSSLEQFMEWEVVLTPEPASAALLLCGAAAILWKRRR